MPTVREGFEDADLTHEWATKYRIPLVTTSHPRWRYEVALVVPPAGEDLLRVRAVWPTLDEALVVASAINFRRAYYNDTYQAKMLARALDVDGTTNTLILLKREDGWYFRRASWSYGPTFVGGPDYPPTAQGLVRLLTERVWDKDRTWQAWVATHHDMFKALEESA